MNHGDRCLAETDPYLVRLVFRRYAARLYLGGDIRLMRQSVHRSVCSYSSAKLYVRERHETINESQRNVLCMNVRAQRIRNRLRRRQTQVYRMVAQGYILVVQTVKRQFSVAVQAVSLTHDVHTDCRVGTKPFEIHRAVRETCIRCEHRIRMSFRHTNLHRTLYRRQVEPGKGECDRRKDDSRSERIGTKRDG